MDTSKLLLLIGAAWLVWRLSVRNRPVTVEFAGDDSDEIVTAELGESPWNW